MSQVTRRQWPGNPDALSRRGRMPCDYEAYVPDLLTGRVIRLDGDVAADVAEAEVAISRLDAAAVAFADTEAFADGNGRTGRGLIQLVLRRRGLASRVVPPVSLVLATWAKNYLEGLTATRYGGSADGAEAHEGLNRWIGRFAGACVRAVEDAAAFESRIQEMEGGWRARLGPVRAGSAADLLLRALPGAPVLTAASATELTGRTFPAVNDAIARLVEGGVLRQITLGKRNRAFEAKEVVDAFTSLERQLASPAGETRSSPPSRPVTPRSPGD